MNKNNVLLQKNHVIEKMILHYLKIVINVLEMDLNKDVLIVIEVINIINKNFHVIRCLKNVLKHLTNMKLVCIVMMDLRN
jgi:hypothetical protein